MDLSLADNPSARHAAGIVQRVFRDYPGSVAVHLWDGNTLELGTGAPGFTLNFRHPQVFRDLVLFRDLLPQACWTGSVWNSWITATCRAMPCSTRSPASACSNMSA